MNYDDDKIDEYTLALLYLVVHDRHEGMGASAWKGFDWETLNRLHARGYISNPISKSKSVGITEEGFLRAEALFERHFTKALKTVTFPKLTGTAKKRWDELSAEAKKGSMDSVWCARCRSGTVMQVRDGKMSGLSLVLRGICKKCGGEVARVIEPEDE
jgi:hypothetical protein